MLSYLLLAISVAFSLFLLILLARSLIWLRGTHQTEGQVEQFDSLEREVSVIFFDKSNRQITFKAYVNLEYQINQQVILRYKINDPFDAKLGESYAVHNIVIMVAGLVLSLLYFVNSLNAQFGVSLANIVINTLLVKLFGGLIILVTVLLAGAIVQNRRFQDIKFTRWFGLILLALLGVMALLG